METKNISELIEKADNFIKPITLEDDGAKFHHHKRG